VHTKRNPTKKARKIKPLITNDQRNADTELPELVVLVAILLLRKSNKTENFVGIWDGRSVMTLALKLDWRENLVNIKWEIRLAHIIMT
jgi:hypothetical protein